jgi:hypothetical protein
LYRVAFSRGTVVWCIAFAIRLSRHRLWVCERGSTLRCRYIYGEQLSLNDRAPT